MSGDIPEALTLGRFLSQLAEYDVWERLLGEINRQLEAKNIILIEGRINIIDASPIKAAQSDSGKGKDGEPKRNKDAGWHVKKDSRGVLKSTYDYPVRMGVDEDGFIQRQTVTAGNVHDSVERPFAIYKSRRDTVYWVGQEYNHLPYCSHRP